MSLLDIDIMYENVLSDALLNRIREYYQRFVSNHLKILSIMQLNGVGKVIELNWDEIFAHSDEWYVYYYMGVDTDWDIELKFAPFKVPYMPGGRTVKEFIDGDIKPRYLL